MDPSNRLAFVLGTLKVDSKDFEPSDWFKVVEVVRRICRPYFRYLSSFLEISNSLNCSLGEYDRRETDIANTKIVSFPEGFNQNTRFYGLAQLSHSAEGKNLAGDGFGAQYVTTRHLLILQDGRLVEWHAKYERVVSHGHGHRGHRSVTTERAMFSNFSWVDDKHLRTLLEEFPKTILSILQRLCEVFDKTIKDNQTRLEGLKERRDEVLGILKRATGN